MELLKFEGTRVTSFQLFSHDKRVYSASCKSKGVLVNSMCVTIFIISGVGVSAADVMPNEQHNTAAVLPTGMKALAINSKCYAYMLSQSSQ